jgi:hypothetical protein
MPSLAQGLGRYGMVRCFGDREIRVVREDGQNFGEIHRRQGQSAGNDFIFLFRRRLAGAN